MTSSTKLHPVSFRALQKRIAPAALAIAAIGAATANAQDSAALIDALVNKGVLTDREAADIRTNLNKDLADSSAAKIKLSNSITELKLYGDLRLRYQYDNRDRQADPAEVGARGITRDEDRSPNSEQSSRWRFRLRLNADFKLGPNWFGGVELQTAQASDSGMQTFENGFDDYNIFISKAYLGWNATDWLTITAGKVPNPFYTTELVWDSDINPTGLTQSFALHKLWAGDPESASSGYAKDGKSAAAAKPSEPKFELFLNAGQFIFDDNLEGGGRDNATRDNDATTDAYLFQTQLVASYKLTKDVKLTVAPGWLTYINGSLSGLSNANSFNDNGTVSGATRNLNILLLPGDVSFKVGGVKAKFFWDFAYNIEGRKRTNDIYDLFTLGALGDDAEAEVDDVDGTVDIDDKDFQHSLQDDFAYHVGVQLGENKKKGDYSLLSSWRQTGIGAVDPNLNDSDFAGAELNTRGVRTSLAYNFTDFLVGAVTYGYAWNLRDDLAGGEATGGNAIADANAFHLFQVDFNLKF